jgi:hypothetical protein
VPLPLANMSLARVALQQARHFGSSAKAAPKINFFPAEVRARMSSSGLAMLSPLRDCVCPSGGSC